MLISSNILQVWVAFQKVASYTNHQFKIPQLYGLLISPIAFHQIYI